MEWRSASGADGAAPDALVSVVPPAPSRASSLLVTLVLCLLAALVLRTVLPRLPRLLFRGRLRVRRAGLRGVRGIEWRQNGFVRKRSATGTAVGAREDDGLVVRVQHVYLVFHGWRRRSGGSSASETATARTAEPALPDGDNPRPAVAAPTAWITIRIQGVGVRLAKAATSAEAHAVQARAAEARRREMEEEAHRRAEAAEAHLQRLIASTPDASALASMSEDAEGDTSLESVVSPPSPSRDTGDTRRAPPPRPEDAHGLPLRGALLFAFFLRYRVLPVVRIQSLRLARALVYVVVSALPALTSFVDVELQRAEVFVQDAESVLRIGRMTFLVSMAVADEPETGETGATDETSRRCASSASFAGRVSAAFKEMPGRLGSGAAGAATYIKANLPAGRASLQVRMEGLQLFEANHEAPHGERPKARLPESRPSSPSPQAWRGPSSRMARRPTSPPETPVRSGSTMSPLLRSASSATPSSPQLHASRAGIDAVPAQWLPFSATPPQEPPTLKRSHSASGIATLSTQPLSGWTDRWADWALEPFPSSSYSSDTGWAKGEARGPVPEGARLLALPDVSVFELGIALDPNLAIGARETVSLRLQLAAVTVGMDAVARTLSVLEQRKSMHHGFAPTKKGLDGTRSQVSKHFAQQRREPAARMLYALSSVSITVPSALFLSDIQTASLAVTQQVREGDKTLPRSLQFRATLRHLSLSLRTSDAADARHRHWLGSCGVKGRRAEPTNMPSVSRSAIGGLKKGIQDRFRWAALRSRARYVEHRQAFTLEAGMESLEALVGTEGRSVELASELLLLREAKLSARSTWTPFGLLPTQCPVDSPLAAQYFVGDPNEQVAVIEASVRQVHGETSLQHAAALGTTLAALLAERKSARAKVGLQDERPPKPPGPAFQPPRLFLGAAVHDCSYHLNLGPQKRAGTDALLGEVSLIANAPRLSLTLQTAYQDAYVGRTENERRHAWKTYSRAAKDKTDSPPTLRPPLARMHSSSSTVSAASHEAIPPPAPPKEGMTMDEALAQMRELQQQSHASGERGPPLHARPNSSASDRRAAASARDRRGKHPTPRAISGPPEANLRYTFDARVACEPIEAFFAVTGDDNSSRRRNDTPTAGRHLPRLGMTRHHLLLVSAIESKINGHVPGFQDCMDTVELAPKRAAADVVVSLQELDIDMWHPAALGATRGLVRVLSDAAALASRLRTAGTALQSSDSAASPAPAVKPLIDRVPATDCSLYASVGAIIMHVGGSDVNCDPHMSRGVGFEAKRVVFEAVSTKYDARRAPDISAGWGSRTALELPEELMLSAHALASRHSKAAAAKLSLFEIGLFPILDAEQALQQHMDGGTGRTRRGMHRESSSEATAALMASPSIFAPAVWEFQKTRPQQTKKKPTHTKFRQQDRSNFIFWMPFSATKAFLRPPGAVSGKVGKRADEITVTSEGTPLLALKIELLHTYCILNALAALKGLVPQRREPAEREHEGKAAEPSPPTAYRPSFSVAIDVQEIHMSIRLPSEVNLFMQLRRLDLRLVDRDNLSLALEQVMAAVETPQRPSKGLWEEAVRFRDWKFQVHLPDRHTGRKLEVAVNGDGLRMRIPFGYPVHPIIDNAAVAFKTTKQLVAQFVKGSKESVIFPVPEDPKHLPKISVNVRIFVIEAQDDPIEVRLNSIWRAGGDENQARMERDVAFADKVNSMRESAEDDAASFLSHAAGSVRTTATASTSGAASGPATSMHSPSSASLPADLPQRTSSDSEHAEHDPAAVNQHFQQRTSAAVKKAREQLDAFNASSWIRRSKNAYLEMSRREEAAARRIYGRYPTQRVSSELPIKMITPARAPPLFRSSMSKLALDIGPPSFAQDKLRDFIHEQGNGVPRDLGYSLLVPMHLRWRMAEWRIQLRDYPMPLLHIPPMHRDQPDDLRSWDLEGDVVLAEHCGGRESIRHVPAVVVPAATGLADAKEYGISVPKMAMPVKFYGSPTIRINTSYPTRATWGQSMQPAIHDMTRVLDTVTSPPHDPSAKLGFWDKLPLVVHGRFGIQFVGDGELHLYLKGSRDPYSILGHGSGWVMCWRGNVDVRLNQQNPDQEVFQILSHQFLLAIPDLRDYIDQAATGVTDKRQDPDESDRRSGNATLLSAGHRYTEEIDFRKIVLRLTNGVRWGIGIKCERTCTDETCKRTPRCSGPAFYRECRFFDAKPHWEVHTRTKEYLDTLPESERGDSFAGYRTDHIHFSLSIFSRPDGLQDYTVRPSSSSTAGDSSANNFYFTPLAWENFWAWMRLFNGAMSLPIRQGPLFPEAQVQSPKFGRHLATLKYRFDLAPLFISHVYPQDIRADWAPGRTTLIGVKARVGTFHLDMHQRQQEMLKDRPEFGDSKKKVFHKPFYEAEMDLDKIDLRTLCAQFTEPDKRLFPSDEDPVSAAAEGERDIFAGDCTLSDRDLEWLDIRDFIEVDWKPPESGEDPKVKLAQAMVCPHFNYHRRLESQRERSHRTASQASQSKQSRRATEQQQEEILRLEFTKFGREDSHTCLVGQGPHSFDVQQALGDERISQLHAELDKLCGADRDHEAAASLRKKIQLITTYLSALKHEHRVPDSREPPTAFPVTKGSAGHGSDKLAMPHMYADWESFNNRHLVHNPTIFFSNTTRDVLLKYYLSSRQRRGVVHHLTARAVRYIRELSARHEGEDHEDESKSHADEDADEASDAKRHGSTSSRGSRRRRQQSRKRTRDTDGATPVEEKKAIDLLQGLLTQTANQVMVESPTEDGPDSSLLDDDIDASEGISDQFDVRRSTICVLIKPQIVLRSEMDERSTIVLTATRTRLRNFSVIDPRSEEDSVNERVLHRNYFTLDGLQAFHPSDSCTFLATANERSGFVYVPLETLVDFRYETNDFDRVVPHTDASVRYDKFNKLRLNDSSRPVAADETGSNPAIDHLVHHMDLARLRCPRFGVVADASHFAAIYNVVTDLLLYRDPAYREHSKRLETMLFSHDFSDTSGLSEVVAGLQYRIRHARELHAQYLMHFEHLNEHGRLDLLALKAEMQDMLDELNLIMEAIATSEEHSSGSDKDKKSALRVEAVAQDITWSMMGADEGELLAKLSVKGASFTWLNKTDNSAANTLSIADLSAVNVHPDAFFAEILSKYKKGAAANHAMAQRGRFLDAMWSVMAPVGGISIVDQFDFKLHPMRLQLESKVGSQLMEYIFGSKRERERRNQKQKADEDESRSPDATDSAKTATSAKSKRTRGGRLTRLFRSGHGNERSEASEEARVSPPTASVRGSTELVGDRPRRPSSTRSASYTNGSGRDSSRSRPATPQGAGSRPDSDEESDPDSHMAIVSRNAAEMRQRAASNRTFVLVKISDTIFNLSYKGEKEKSITNVYDLVFHSPNIEYRNRTWAYVDLANHFKRDIIRAAWGQKTSILRGVLNHRPRRTSLRAHLPARIASGAGLSVRVEPPTPTSSMLLSRDDEPDTPESPQSMLSDLEEDGSSDEEAEQEREVPESDADEPHSGNTTASRASTASPGRFSRFITKRLRPRSGSGSSGATHETVRMDRDDSHSSDPDGSSPGLRSPGEEARRMLRPTDTFAFSEHGASLPPRGSSRQSSPAPRAGSLGDRRASSPLSFLMSRRPSSPLGREGDGPGDSEDADGSLAAAAAERTRALFGLGRRSSSPAPTPS